MQTNSNTTKPSSTWTHPRCCYVLEQFILYAWEAPGIKESYNSIQYLVPAIYRALFSSTGYNRESSKNVKGVWRSHTRNKQWIFQCISNHSHYKLSLSQNDDHGIMSMKRGMLKSIYDRYNKDIKLQPLCVLATVLDLRFKLKGFSNVSIK